MKTPLLRAWILGGLILFMDQWTKGLVVAHLELGEQREWVEGFFPSCLLGQHWCGLEHVSRKQLSPRGSSHGRFVIAAWREEPI